MNLYHGGPLVGLGFAANFSGLGQSVSRDAHLISTFAKSPGLANLTGAYSGVLRFGGAGEGWTIIGGAGRTAHRIARVSGFLGAGLQVNEINRRITGGDDPVVIVAKSCIDFGAGALLSVWPIGTAIGGVYIVGDAVHPGAVDRGIESFYNGLSDPEYQDLWLRALSRGPYDW